MLANPQLNLAQAVRHLKAIRLTTAELAKLAGISFRTLQDIEREKAGNGPDNEPGLWRARTQLGVVRVSHDDAFRAASTPESAEESLRTERRPVEPPSFSGIGEILAGVNTLSQRLEASSQLPRQAKLRNPRLTWPEIVNN